MLFDRVRISVVMGCRALIRLAAASRSWTQFWTQHRNFQNLDAWFFDMSSDPRFLLMRFMPIVEIFNQQGGWRSETVRNQGGSRSL